MTWKIKDDPLGLGVAGILLVAVTWWGLCAVALVLGIVWLWRHM